MTTTKVDKEQMRRRNAFNHAAEELDRMAECRRRSTQNAAKTELAKILDGFAKEIRTAAQ